MAIYKIEALWDCVFCNSKAIKGSLRECPNCGNPRGDEVTFYLPQNIAPENAAGNSEAISDKPDWLCAFCGRYSPDREVNCISCGASRADSEKNYIDIHTQE